MKARPNSILTNIFLGLILVTSPCLAHVWHVPDDAPTIQAGIDLAQPGDIVQVRLAASTTVVKGVTQLVSKGGTTAGVVAPETVDATTLAGAVFGVADEDATTTTATALIR